MPRLINEKGKRRGRLIGISYINGGKWLYGCDCGNQKVINATEVRSGKIKSCGCLLKETSRARMTKHGYSNTKLYNVWKSMKRRCCSVTDCHYKDYGARGIKVCKRWRDSYINFLEDMGMSYRIGLTLDRINNNKGYSKINCRWVGFKEQSRNRRSNVVYTINGETRILVEWCELYNIPLCNVLRRLRIGWPIQKALSEAVKTRYKTEDVKKRLDELEEIKQ